MAKFTFEWDDDKNALNQKRHGVAFIDAQEAFFDRDRIIARDEAHSVLEERLFCIGKTPKGILTVRFTIRGHRIRIIGAGNWRKWREFYEKTRRS
jgi:uncharacterized DUF497 family protein